MALYRNIDFRQGGALDDFGALPTITGNNFKVAEMGLAFEGGASKHIQYDKQLLPDNAFSVVIWARLKYTHVIGSERAMVINFTTSQLGINISYSGSSGKPILYMKASDCFKYFNYIPDKKWHCWVFTVAGATKADIGTSKLFVDTLEKAGDAATVTGDPTPRSSFVYAGGGNTATSGAMIAKLKVYDTVLTTAEINKEQEEFEQARAMTRMTKCNMPLPNGATLTLNEDWKYYGIGNSPTRRGEWIKSSGDYSVQQWINRYGEIIVNGDFSNGSTGWTLEAGWSVVGGKATKVAGGTGRLVYTIKNEVQKSYIVTFTISDYVAGNIVVQLSGGGGGTGVARDANGTYTEIIKSGITIPGGMYFIPSASFAGSIDNISVKEVYVKPNSFYLKCNTAGVLGIPSSQASGMWSIEWLKGADTNLLTIAISSTSLNIGAGYSFTIGSAEDIKFYRTGSALPFQTVNAYITNNTFYTIRVYRNGSVAGKFPKRLIPAETVYGAWYSLVTIQGGVFTTETVIGDVSVPKDGVGDINVAGLVSGNNPFNDVSNKTSKYFCIDADANDFIGNIRHETSWTL